MPTIIQSLYEEITNELKILNLIKIKIKILKII